MRSCSFSARDGVSCVNNCPAALSVSDEMFAAGLDGMTAEDIDGELPGTVDLHLM